MERLLEVNIFRPLGIEKIEEEHELDSVREGGPTNIKLEGSNLFGRQ